ncbi:glycoside hydrolase family 43 protein [Coprobacter fastidiosus]|uniref:Beta-xylosidase n=1 Tax=Coprobacter fastidiosus NSB1 = JCM 33896 TaxID=1349822 RepID=A0A495VJ20_9BACT|nr:glycoside hydrolase 43 family protein [Coprobacter fastidiosus]ERM89146.1 glycoside hydrolase [Coprobacter fastidiosus NSB1 = JCM 33896]RKT49252.1 beta-xylosidase [Coprobacter fastidiosus NSB1 = JCM 33896]BEG63011.1 glycoside hydrolase 43 family protein [Coprobacter fastidiosus]
MKNIWTAVICLLLCWGTVSAQSYVSQVWVSDLGNGKYKNPVLDADYSDPDVCRVGDDYYMTSSSFACIPALQILHSKDMVNWRIIGTAIERLLPEERFSQMQHGNGVWAPSIRYHRGEFYIYYGDPDTGIYMVKSKDPAGKWDNPVLVKAAKGIIDTCPLWDEDGNAYIVHGYAGSRAGLKSILGLIRMTPDGTRAIGESRIIFDGHIGNATIEGPKFYKRDGWYYIFAPAGGVPTGWQTVLRSKNIWGPYEWKIVMAQGNTNINGPHQGAWVDTPDGKEDWFFHFQDKEAYGRVVHLQPMKWVDGWPVIGVDKDGDGCGSPVYSYKKPNVGKTYSIETPAESDEFDSLELGLQWQWQANPKPIWYFCDGGNSLLRLYSYYTENQVNLWDVPNLLLQKFPTEDFTVTTKVSFAPSSKYTGERTGLVVMGADYAVLAIENRADGLILVQNVCRKADKKGKEEENASVKLSDNTLFLRVKVKKDSEKEAICSFSYSVDGKKFISLGENFTAKPGKWIGAKVGLFITRPKAVNDGGWVDIDWFRVTK